VRNTPISENAMIRGSVGGGSHRHAARIEIMFAIYAALEFDQK